MSVAASVPLSEAARERFSAALVAESKGDWSTAAAQYGVILAVYGGHEASVLGLGRALEAQGDVETALLTYERLGENPKAIEARAFLLEATDPLRAAELYRLQQAIQLGDPWPYLGEARALKRVDVLGAAAAVDGHLDLTKEPPKGAVILDVVGALRAAGEDQRAEELLRRILKEWPSVSWADEVQSRLDRLRIERAALDFVVGEPTPLNAAELQQLAQARLLASSGKSDVAVQLLSELVRNAPSNAEPWGALGAIHAAQGKMADAEVAYIRAISAAPNVAKWHRHFAELLIDSYGGKRDREARDSYRTALELRPTWTEVAYRLAETERSLRDYDDALRAYRTVLALEAEGPWSTLAKQRIRDLGRKAPDIGNEDHGGRGLEGVDPAAIQHFRLARAYRAEDRLDDALAEAELALSIAADWTGAINLLAALRVARGEMDSGLAAWERSIELNPNQPAVLLAVAELAAVRRDPKAAEEAYRAASALGSAEALYRLAELAHEDGDPDRARVWLAQFFEQTAGGPMHAPAVALSSTLEAQLQRRRLMVSAAFLSFLALVAGLVWRRVRRKTLADLVERAPGVAHDVSLVVSAVRHELLKHNTSLLGEMATALEDGDDEAVVYGAERLFGWAGQESVTSRYDAYLEQLVTLGRSHGVHLDLRDSDPVFGPISRSMSALYRIRRKLRVPPANSTARAGLAATVAAIGHALNVDAYGHLGDLLASLRTCALDQKLVDRIDRRVRSEPGFVGHSMPGLEVDMLAAVTHVAISRGDLEDALTNLFRNAHQAMLDGGADGEARIGFSVTHRVDEITGLLRVELRVLDMAAGRLTTAMIMESTVGRGLGLVRDLVERHGGTVNVESASGWSKAIVLDLDRADRGDEC